jgi:hypothetical protein
MTEHPAKLFELRSESTTIDITFTTIARIFRSSEFTTWRPLRVSLTVLRQIEQALIIADKFQEVMSSVSGGAYSGKWVILSPASSDQRGLMTY